MNNCGLELSDSPSRVGNFLISCAIEADIVGEIQPSELLHFLGSGVNEDFNAISNTDSAFFPRAFTDTDLLDEGLFNPDCSLSDKNNLTKKSENMAGRFGSDLGNYKPDVVLSNSHQRSGPDGSPALAPPASQGLMASNLSETGELFAPVRTLTFSDVDQSSHIEDSYINNSRLVSTPNREERRPPQNQYDYSNMHGGLHQTGGMNNVDGNDGDEDDSDSSGSGDVITVGRKRFSEFRQLEGEADPDFQSTGPFHPSAHGLSKEFMDQFVGKTGNTDFESNMDIFSPLGPNSFKVAERRIQSCTPPLHSPAPDSPLAKYSKGSPGSPYYKRNQGRQQQDDEVQFAMSPTRSHQPFQREVIGYGPYLESGRVMGHQLYHQEHTDYTFKPVDNPVKMLGQSVPKNLNEYFNQHDNENIAALTGRGLGLGSNLNRQYYHDNWRQDDDNDLDLDSRQGDGSDSDGDEGPHRLPQMVHVQQGQERADRQMRQEEPAAFQRMQVSVKLPQATYDTLSANTSNDDKFNGDSSAFKAALKDCPPDIALSGADGCSGTANFRTSPEKVMDLLQNQPGSMSADGTGLSQKSPYQNSFGDKTKDTSKPEMDGPEIQTIQPHQSEKHYVKKSVAEEDGSSYEQKVLASDKSHFEQELNAVSKVKQTPNSQGVIKPVSGPTTMPSQNSNHSQPQTSSRLMQETVSQRNKTTQKYVSNVPGIAKTGASNQNKEFKKPFDVPQKNSTSSMGHQGARKPVTSDTGQKFKVSDKVKPKTTSTENLAQKQRGNSGVPARNGGPNQGQINRGQGQKGQNEARNSHGQQGHVDEGQGHDGSLHSIEDGGESSRLVTQVQTTSPVPIEQPEQTVGPVQVGCKKNPSCIE